MKRGSQPRARSPSTAPRRPDLTLKCTQWRGGQELITGTGRGAADERGGSGGGRPPDHCAQTPARSRGRRGEVCTEDAGPAAAWSDPRGTPTEGAKLGPPGGRRSQETKRGLRAGEGRDSSREHAPSRHLPPDPQPAEQGSADCLLSVSPPPPPGAQRPGSRSLPVLPACVIHSPSPPLRL